MQDDIIQPIPERKTIARYTIKDSVFSDLLFTLDIKYNYQGIYCILLKLIMTISSVQTKIYTKARR